MNRVPAALAGWLGRLAARDGRRPRLVVLCACLAVVAMYCTNSDMGGQPDAPRGDGVYRPVLARGDGHMLYLIARSMALDGDWRFDNDLARFGDPWRQRTTATGRKANPHPIGPALVWTPLIWIAQGGAVIANQLGADIELHGYTLWHQRLAFLVSPLAACAAILLAARLARRLFDSRWAAAYAAVAVLLGSSLTYYATHMPSYGHALDSLACGGFLYYWATTLGRSDRRRWLVLGVLLGLAALIRVQGVALAVVVILEVAAETVRHRGRAWRWWLGGAAAAAAALLVFVPQLVEWKLVFGSFTSLPQGPRYTRLEAPMIAETLFAARNGWFSTTPIAYAAVIGLCALPRRLRLLGAGLLAAIAIQVYLCSTINDWWGGAAFGQRRLCNVTVALVVGLACLIWRAGQLARRLPAFARHAIAIAILAPFLAWNLTRVFELRGGRAAPDALSPSCCGRVPRPIRGAVTWLYDTIGPPFQLPASLVFAVRHGVPINRWDQTVGNYPLIPYSDSLLDDTVWRLRGSWRIGHPGIEPYLVDGFSASLRTSGGAAPGSPRDRVSEAPGLRTDRPQRWTTAPRATVLVPNLLPYGQRFTLWLAPGGARRAVVRWNGELIADAELTGWTPVRFDLPDIALHTNELTIEAALAPAPGAPGPVGVAVGDLEVEFLRR